MHARDLLLIVAAVLAVAAGAMVAPALGVAAGSVACGAAWWLLGETE